MKSMVYPLVAAATPHEEASHRRALLVLGMHRSGTSAVTRVMSLLGAGLPSDLIGPRPNDNETGFWESTALNEAHEAMLESAGSSWDDVSPFNPAWFGSNIANEFLERVVRVVQDKFGDAPLIVVKDPRICRFVPFWRRVLNRLEIQPAFVLPIRNPMEIVGSLRARNKFPPAKSLLLWLRHLLDAERDTRGQIRSFVSYELLLQDWQAVADKLQADLRLSWPRRSHLASAEISSFLSPQLRHHQADIQQLKGHSDVVEWVAEAYDAALGAATGVGDHLSTALDAVRNHLDTADRAFGPALADLLKQVSRSGEIVTERRATIERLSAELDSLRQEIPNQEQRIAAQSERMAELERQRDIASQSALLASQARDLALGEAELARQARDLAQQEAQQASSQAERAIEERNASQCAAEQAEEQRRLARQEAEQAEEQRRLARQEAEQAEEQRRLARQEAEQAEEQRRLARQEAEQAEEQRRLARQEAEQAEEQRRLARQEAEQAEEQRRLARQEAEQAQQEALQMQRNWDGARCEAEQAREETARLQELLDEWFRSRSYRMTAPIRAVLRSLRQLR